jgi:hypothetical protein
MLRVITTLFACLALAFSCSPTLAANVALPDGTKQWTMVGGKLGWYRHTHSPLNVMFTFETVYVQPKGVTFAVGDTLNVGLDLTVEPGKGTDQAPSQTFDCTVTTVLLGIGGADTTAAICTAEVAYSAAAITANSFTARVEGCCRPPAANSVLLTKPVVLRSRVMIGDGRLRLRDIVVVECVRCLLLLSRVCVCAYLRHTQVSLSIKLQLELSPLLYDATGDPMNAFLVAVLSMCACVFTSHKTHDRH